MAFSNSFHSSAKAHSIGSSAALSKVGRHNSRGYLSFYYDADKIHALIGTPNRIPSDVAHFINDTFGTCVDEYNKKQKRSDRMIQSDAFSYFCENKKLDVAVETIFQIGDMDFWARHRTAEIIRRRGNEFILKDFPEEVKKVMDAIFMRQIDAYEHIYETDSNRILAKIKAHYEKSQATLTEFAEHDPNAYSWCLELASIKNSKTRENRVDKLGAEEKEKYTIFAEAYFAVESIEKFRYVERIQNKQMHINVINSVSHYDEWSPHNHVVSVCWADGYQNGLSSRVAKSMVLNRYALEVLQEKMHDIALEEIAKHPEIFADEVLKEKTRGRNFDFTTEQYIRMKQEKLLQNVDELKEDIRFNQQRKAAAEQEAKIARAEADQVIQTTIQSKEEYIQEVSSITRYFGKFFDRLLDVVMPIASAVSTDEINKAVNVFHAFWQHAQEEFKEIGRKIKNLFGFEHKTNMPAEERQAQSLLEKLTDAEARASHVNSQTEASLKKEEVLE